MKINKVNICLMATHWCFMEVKNTVQQLTSFLPISSENSNAETEPTKPKNNKEIFLDIIKLNDTKSMHAFIKNTGANIHQFGPHDETTPLIEASAHGYINSVCALITAGADVTATDKLHQRTPLQWAFINNHLNVCKCLLDAMSPEQIDFQMKYQSTRFPTLNTFIQTHQINKLQSEVSAVYDSENGNFSRLATLPCELLITIFSHNYPTLTSGQISQNINLVYKRVYGTEVVTTTLESTSKPVKFSTTPSATMLVAHKNLENTKKHYNKTKNSKI